MQFECTDQVLQVLDLLRWLSEMQDKKAQNCTVLKINRITNHASGWLNA